MYLHLELKTMATERLAEAVARPDLNLAQLLDTAEVEAGVRERGQRIDRDFNLRRLGVAVGA